MIFERKLKKIYLDRKLQDGIIAKTVQERLDRNVELEWIDEPKKLLERRVKFGAPFPEDSAELMIYSFPGRFLSSCPGTDGMVCCHYFVINTGVGCIFDCRYCYLHAYQNQPLLTLHGNIEDIFSELRQTLRGKNHHFRIGTGEFSDSMGMDALTGFSAHLVRFFAEMDNATLELKTKSSQVEELLGLDHGGNTVLAWSLNPESIIQKIELGTASLKERLNAAKRAEEAGYRLAFHLDPMVFFDGWELEYCQLIDELFDTVRPESVAWISLGTFRCNSDLKENIQARFPGDELTGAEMVQASDGKYRYFKTIREEMYRTIRKKIESVDPRLFMYLCMETKRMWERVFDYVPESAKNLDALFEKKRNGMFPIKSICKTD